MRLAADAASLRLSVSDRGPGMTADVVRELKALEPAHYLTKPAEPDEILAAFGRADGAEPAAAERPDTVPSLARVEWEHIQRVLTDCGGNVSKAARLLGLHRRSLQRRLGKAPVRR